MNTQKTTIIICEVCGQEFKGRVYKYGYTDKICSPACKALRRAEKIETVTCKCGKVFTAYKSEHRVSCSRSCASNIKINNRRIRAKSLNTILLTST